MPLLSLLAVIIAAGAWMLLRPPPYAGPSGAVDADTAHPDALIRTSSLAKLPADLLRIPLARDVLSEDFVTYYEQNENRLALSGAVRRIAFEHKLDFPERLLESVLDEPAEVALWRDSGGRLRHFMVVMPRNTLARAIQTLLPVVSSVTDMQLSSAGKLDGTEVEILVLEYGYRHRLLLLAKDERVVALSDPGMLLVSDGGGERPWKQAEKMVALLGKLLDGKNAVSPFAKAFHLTEALPEKKHELILGASVFAFGYGVFAPGLEALRLSFDDQGAWQSSVALNAPRPDDGALWAALPYGPSLCASVPVDWTRLAVLLGSFNDRYAQPVVPAQFVDRFKGSAAVCWYKDSRLYTPLFAARLNAAVNEKQTQEFFALADAAINGESAASFDAASGSGRWQSGVASKFGASGDKGERMLKPALALQRDLVFFSPDARLVDSAIDVAAKRYPALADKFAHTDGSALAFIDPEALAGLLRKETFAALPRNEEPIFRNAADAWLAPRLEALARYPAQRVRFAADKADKPHAWHVLEWEADGAVR
ncbi:MAG: DUF2138 family protein [Candidatus Accumulibacter sp.]|nr:DUF2138 family protein [Accumulibacter sp.]